MTINYCIARFINLSWNRKLIFKILLQSLVSLMMGNLIKR